MAWINFPDGSVNLDLVRYIRVDEVSGTGVVKLYLDATNYLEIGTVNTAQEAEDAVRSLVRSLDLADYLP